MDNRTIEQVRENETIWINKAIKLEDKLKRIKEAYLRPKSAGTSPHFDVSHLIMGL